MNGGMGEDRMEIKVGILGFAHGHVESYLNVWKNDSRLGVKVIAGWDYDRERLSRAVQKHQIIGYDTPEELLDNADVQAVVITVETAYHADLVEKAAAAGKAIVLQKPLALTIEQGERIVAAVKKHSVPFTMAWQMRVDAQNLRMKEMIDREELGKVLTVRRRHGLTTHTWVGFEDTWHNSPTLNRDIWADDTSHPIDWINSLFGAPESVTAEVMTLVNPKVPNDNGVVIFRYPNGPLVEVSCSFTCLAAVGDTEIICEKGTIVHNFGDAPSCSISRPEGVTGLLWYSNDVKKWENSNIPTPPDHWSRIAALAKPLAEFLHGERPPIATAEEALISLRMVLATYVSSHEGRRVSIYDEAISHL
jgi:predicted dehydrogenase